LGIYRLDYEIRSRGLYWNNLSWDVKLYVNNFVVYTKSKLNFSHKHFSKQILSYKPLERVKMDITYLSKLNANLFEDYRYLLCFVEHSS
jgi:hypothetical protein